MLTTILSAQTLIGRIIDTQGAAIPNATLYIRENAHGIMADENGVFQLTIGKGDYTCEVSSLGYEKKTTTISVPEEGANITIELVEKAYKLSEVTVLPGKEDPAYRIMRNVIARAPYYFNQVKEYESGVYLKGTFKIEKIPALIKMQIDDKEFKDLIGKLLILESQNELKYSTPNKYEQRVIAMSSTIPEKLNIGDNIPMSILTNNIYEPSAFGGMLAPGSFSVYKFKLEDSYDEDGHQISKIRVIPRKKSGRLVSGWLYIADNKWTIQRADLSRSEAGVTTRFNLIYHEIKPGTFLPTTYDFSVKYDILGMKGNGQVYASIKYNRLETNDNNITLAQTDTIAATKPTATIREALTKKQQSNLQKIEELSNKNDLTTREAYKMAKLTHKAVKEHELFTSRSSSFNKRRTLELPSLDSLIMVTRDSLALMRDSSFWNQARTLPLRGEELQSYMQRDSMKIAKDSTNKADSLNKRDAILWTTNILFGEEIKVGKKFFVGYEGVLPAFIMYNFVDGFWLGQQLRGGIKFDDNRSLSIKPAVYYVTARKTANVMIDGTLTYAPMRNGKLTVSTGNTSADFADNNGTGRLGNMLGSLFLTINTAKFYKKEYAAISNKVDIANGLALTAGINYEKRSDLENHTSYSILGKNPASNRPHGHPNPMPTHEALVTNAMIEYTPMHYYSVYKGRKIYRQSAFPTMRLQYKRGFSGTSFDNLEASVFQDIRLGLFDRLSYEVNAGKFLSSEQVYLPDFKHFRTSETFLTGKSLNYSFMMDNYKYATNDRWLQTHITYSSNYMLIKHIPALQSYFFDEALHVSSLWIPNMNHNEIGYSIGIDALGRIGVVVGFKDLKYENVGFVISLPLISGQRK